MHEKHAARRRAPLPALLLLLLALCLPGAARADELDLLQDLDTAMADTAADQDKAEGDQGFGAQLRDNLDLSIRLRGTHFIQSAKETPLPMDKESAHGEVKLDYATAATWARLRLATSGWLETGTQDDTYAGITEFMQDNDRRRNAWEINEIYGTIDMGAADLTLGRKVLLNGISTLASPANRYSGLDLNDPLDPRRLGVWQAALDVADDDTTWTFAVLPFFAPPKTPGAESRWVAGNAWDGIPNYFGVDTSQFDELLDILYFFSDLSGVDIVSLVERITGINFGGVTPVVDVKYDLPDGDDPENWGYFGRVKTSAGRYDLFASAYRGPSIYPVLRAKVDQAMPSVTLIAEHPIADQIAAGASTTWKELELHGEALYSHSEEGRDDSYVQYVLGSTWSNQSVANRFDLYRLDLTAEYVGEAITTKQSADGYLMSSKYARLGRNDAIARLAVHFTETVSAEYMCDILLSTPARLHRIGATWRVTDALTWKAAFEAFDGPDNTYYGRWRDQDRVTTSLTYTF